MDVVLPGLAVLEDLHPLVVHFPIALWSTALLFWFLGVDGREPLWSAGRWLVYLGALSAVAAVATGLWAAERIGHDTPGHEFVHVHRNFMIATTALGGVTAGLAWLWRERREAWRRWALCGGLVLTAALGALGADRGALLVYGHGIGTRALSEPEPARSAPPEPREVHEHGEHAH